MSGPEHEVTYTGELYVQPVGRGVVLSGTSDQPQLEDWIEGALQAAGILVDGDGWREEGRTTEPVKLTLRLERAPSGPGTTGEAGPSA